LYSIKNTKNVNIIHGGKWNEQIWNTDLNFNDFVLCWKAARIYVGAVIFLVLKWAL
jgi:hypothetical protein